MQLAYQTFDLPLKHVFTIARGSVSVQTTLIVQLSAGGHHGYGEATTNRYYNATVESMTAALESVREVLEFAELNISSSDPVGEVLAKLAGPLEDNPFPHCAIDQALHDLWGKQVGKPIHELWGLDRSKAPISNYTIGIDTIPKMVEKLEEFAGWPIYKIKLGTDDDLQIVKELRQHTDATFRVDANCGWGVDQTIELSKALGPLGVEFIEQPLPREDLAGAEQVFKHSALPIMADESCINETDVAQCDGRFHGVNIKLMKCGGLAAGRRMALDARQRGLKVMAGCMTESTVGISALAQLAPLLDYVDMDGAALLKSDIAHGAKVERGVCHYPDDPGTGVSLLDGPIAAIAS